MFSPEFLTMVIAYGLTVIGIVEVIKRAFKMAEIAVWLKVLVTVLASIAVTIPSFNDFTLFGYVILVVCVVLEANGIFKALHTKET